MANSSETVENETKSIIRSLLASTPLKSTINTLMKDFVDTVGYELPFRQLGFANPEQYLRSIPDVVQVNGYGAQAEVQQVHSEKIAHIKEMIAKQRMPKCVNKRGTTHSRTKLTVQPCRQYQQYQQPVYMSNRPMPPFVTSPFPFHFTNQAMPQYNPMYCQPLRIPYTTSGAQRRKPHSNPLTTSTPQKIKPHSAPFPQHQHTSPCTSDPKKSNWSRQQQHNSKPPNESRSMQNVPPKPQLDPTLTTPPIKIKPERSTAVQKMNMSSCMKDYVKKQLLSVEEEEDSMFYDEVEDRVPQEVKNNLRNLISDHPEGIWCCDLPKLYKARYLTDLNYTAYKFRTLNEMCLYLASIFHYIRPNKGDFKLYNKQHPIPLDLSLDVFTNSDLSEDQHSVVSDDLGIPEIEKLVVSEEPSNVVQYLDEIPRQWLQRDSKEGSFIDLSVAETYDPSKFWFIINKEELDTMMDELQEYYLVNKHKLEIPPDKLKEGLYCCAIFMNEYHRAIIIHKSAMASENKVKVYFIDYGTVCKISTKGICYLHQKFKTLPQQAIRGRLAHVYPINMQEQWPKETTGRFFELIVKKNLVGKIEKINHEDQKQVECNKYAVPIVRHLHYYPTFDELEQGLVPSAPEMLNLLNNGCSIELVYPQYFKKTYYKHELEKLLSEENDNVALRKVSEDECESDLPKTSSTDSKTSTESESEACKTTSPLEESGSETVETEAEVLMETQAPSQESVPQASKASTGAHLRPPPGFQNVQPNFQAFAHSHQVLQPVFQQNYYFQPPQYYQMAYMMPYGFGLAPQTMVLPQPLVHQQAPPSLQQPNGLVQEYFSLLGNSGNKRFPKISESSSDSTGETGIPTAVSGVVELATEESTGKITNESVKQPVENVQEAKEQQRPLQPENLKRHKKKKRGKKKQAVDKSNVVSEEQQFGEQLNVLESNLLVDANATEQENDISLLDANEVELDAVLSRPESGCDHVFIGNDKLEEFLSVTPKTLASELLSVPQQEFERTKNFDFKAVIDNHVTPKVIAGKTVKVVQLEDGHYVTVCEILKSFANLEQSISSTKRLIARRNIMIKDLDLEQLEESLKEELLRNELVTKSKFGSFVHLVQLEQLPSFLRTFVPQIELGDFGGFM